MRARPTRTSSSLRSVYLVCDSTRSNELLSASPGTLGLASPRCFWPSNNSWVVRSARRPLARISAGRLRAGSSRAASRYVEYKGVLGRAVAPRQPRREGPLRALWRHLQVEVHFSALLLTTQAGTGENRSCLELLQSLSRAPRARHARNMQSNCTYQEAGRPGRRRGLDRFLVIFLMPPPPSLPPISPTAVAETMPPPAANSV